MGARRGLRRVVALGVLVALAVGVALFVGVWLLGEGGTDDEGAAGPVTIGPVTFSPA